MAEVLVTTQTIPIMNLHPAEAYHGHSSGQSHHSSQRASQVPRGYNGHNASIPYRGPVAPYAFQSTPNLRQTSSPNNVPAQRQSLAPNALNAHRQSYAPSAASSSTSSSNPSSNSSNAVYTVSKDDSAIVSKSSSTLDRTNLFSSSTPDLSLVSFNDTAKPSPDRYRRTVKRVDSNSSATAGAQQPANTQRFSQQWPTPQAAHQATQHQFRPPMGHIRTESADDVIAGRQPSAGRYRRRSVSALEAGTAVKPTSLPVTAVAPTWSQIAARANSAPDVSGVSQNAASRPIGQQQHQRADSAGSHSSGGSSTARRPGSSRQESHASPKAPAVARPINSPTSSARPSSARGSESAKRVISPSPLSRPMTSGAEHRPSSSVSSKPPASPSLRPQTATQQSPAQQHLAALSQQDPNKGMKSRLRRAFSFGSAQELRKASAQNNVNKLRKDQPTPEEELQGEDARVAAQQEAAGIGAGIYSGQGVVYSSTDNLSISSTASSASIMLRKMGRGVKKSTKSLRGLFRPKSIIGDPTADGAVAEPSVATAEVSRVTVEAEREKVNVNAEPNERPHGETGYPKLQRNSIDAATAASHERPSSSRHGQSDSLPSRKSIVGSDRERQEVLNAVKKGILKRNNTSSPIHGELNPRDIPSIPGTPEGSIRNEEFFPTNRLGNNGSTRSLPDRPGVLRNVSWNPKVSFHDVWAGNEYDRRGDIATCNRLTPMLAQQIKEELNSFKMEMEVHEASKPHTHFF